MTIVQFKIVGKSGVLSDVSVPDGRLSEDRIGHILRAAFLSYSKCDLATIANSFSNNRGKKSYVASLKPIYYVDIQRAEHGHWFGTADCRVFASRSLSPDELEFLVVEGAKSQGIINAKP
jgi:hypothetical protein